MMHSKPDALQCPANCNAEISLGFASQTDFINSGLILLPGYWLNYCTSKCAIYDAYDCLKLAISENSVTDTVQSYKQLTTVKSVADVCK